MTTKKERKWLGTEEHKSLPTILTSKPIQKSWRSCPVSSDDSKPAIKSSRKILRLGQNDSDRNQKSALENNKPKIENIVWNVRNTSKPNSYSPIPCKAVSREFVQKEKVSPGRKQAQNDEKFVKRNDQLKLNRTCTEEPKQIDEMRANSPGDVRKVISKSCDDKKLDNFKNKSSSLSSGRSSLTPNECQNPKRLYSPLISSPFVDNDESKSNQKDNIQRSAASNQTDKNSNVGNKANFERSKDISLHSTLRKSESESFNKPKKIADQFLSITDPFRETEFGRESFDYKGTTDHKQSKGFNLNDSLDSENIQTYPELSESNENGACGENQSKKCHSLSANFGALTDEDLEDFVLNLKRFLQAKIVNTQHMQSELSNNLKDSNVHGSNCHCLACDKVGVDESNKIIENLCSHFEKNSGKKIPVIDSGSLNKISVIATVRVVDSISDINNGEEQSLEYLKGKCEDKDQQKDGVPSFVGKCEDEDKRNKDGVPSFVGKCEDEDQQKDGVPSFIEKCEDKDQQNKDGVPSFVGKCKDEDKRNKDGVPSFIEKCEDENQQNKACMLSFVGKCKDENQQNKDGVPSFIEKCEDENQQNKACVLSFEKRTLIKSNTEKSNSIQTNSNEYKDGDLTVPSLVCDKKLIKLFYHSQNRYTNSSVTCRGKFSEFAIPLKREINRSLILKNITRKYNSKIFPRSFKGIQSKISHQNSLAPFKGFNMQWNKPISNCIMAHFISKYCAKFFLSAKNWFCFQTERKVLHTQFVNKNKISTQDLIKNSECKNIKQPSEVKETGLEVVDPVTYLKKLFLKKKEKNSTHKTDCSTSKKDLHLRYSKDDNSAEKTPKLKTSTLLPITNLQQYKNAASSHETNLFVFPEFIPESQPHEEKIKAPREEKYIKNYVSDTTDDSDEIEAYLEQTSLFEKTLIKEKQTHKSSPSKTVLCNSETAASKSLASNQDLEVYEYFANNILSAEKIPLATISTHEEASISIIPKNEPIPREPFELDFLNLENTASLREKLLINPSSKVDNLLSTCSTPPAPVEMQGSDDEEKKIVSIESLDQTDSFLSELKADDDDDVFSQDWDILIQQTSCESLSATNKSTKDYISKFVNVDSPVNSGRFSQVDSDNNFQSISSDEEKKEETIFSLKQEPSNFAEDATSKIKDLDNTLEITDTESSPANQNEDYNNDDDDDDSDSVLSLYAPSSASFLDEDEANNSDNRSVEDLSFKEEKKPIKIEPIPMEASPKVECKVIPNMEDETLSLKVENVGVPTLDDMKKDSILDDQLTPSQTKQQVLKTQDEFEESSTMTIRIEDLPVPVGFCYQFIKKGQCSKLPACHFKHEIPSKEEILSFSFSEECKNGKLNKAFDLFALLKDLNNDSLEMTGLLLRSCLSQSNGDMTFLLIPDLIRHKMLTPKIVHDIFTICASCPFKYEEKLWKLYETMMLLNLCPSLNSIIILLQMYFEMLNWSKIWQLLLNTILIEPLSVIPIPICHGALTYVLNDASCQYLLQAVNWICMSAVDDLWNIEPCLLYHLSVLFKTKSYLNAYWILHKHLQQINTYPEEIVFTEEVDEPQTNAEYISCLQNIQEIQAKKNWLQLSDIFIFIYESSQLHSSWFILPIVEAFLKIDNFSMMTTVFNDFVSSTCSRLNSLVKENSSYPISGCRRHLVRMIMDLIRFCYSNKIWAEGSQIVSTFLKNELEFDLKDHLDSIPHDSVLFALDICLHSEEPMEAISLLEGIGWFCQLPPGQFIQSLHLKQWLKKILQVLIEQLSNIDKLPNGCRVFSLFVSIIQEETKRWHKEDKLSPFNPKQFSCINHVDLMNVSNKFILQCLMSEDVNSAIYAFNMIKSLLPKVNPRCCNVATFRALLVAAHLGPRIPPCVRELYNFCSRQLETYPPQKLIQPPWTLEVMLHLTNIEMHLVIEDFLDCLYNILINQSKVCQQMTLKDLQLCVIVRTDIVTDVFPNICYLRNVPINRMEVLQQALFVLQTYVVPPLEAKIDNCQTGLLVNPESLKHFIFIKDSQRRNPGPQFHPVPKKKPKPRFRGKARFR